MAGDVQADDFDIAKSVFDKLKDLPLERKRRILGWVAESLGIESQTPSSAVQTPHLHPPAAPATPAVPTPGGTDIKTFVAAKAPKSDTQFAATVAYYYRFEAAAEHRRDTITSEILQEAARLAGRARFSKPHKTLNNAKGLGYLDSGARGEFKVNSVGENLVAMTLPGEVDVPKSAPRRRKAPNKKKTSRKR